MPGYQSTGKHERSTDCAVTLNFSCRPTSKHRLAFELSKRTIDLPLQNQEIFCSGFLNFGAGTRT